MIIIILYCKIKPPVASKPTCNFFSNLLHNLCIAQSRERKNSLAAYSKRAKHDKSKSCRIICSNILRAIIFQFLRALKLKHTKYVCTYNSDTRITFETSKNLFSLINFSRNVYFVVCVFAVRPRPEKQQIIGRIEQYFC